jgi:3-oxoacyl-[acyl-carrier-protein] synthase II
MNSSRRRVVITGIGVISPLGNSKQALWDALSTGRSGVGDSTVSPHGALPVSISAEAREFTGKIDDFGPLEKDQKKAIRKNLKVMCRECQMGVAAAQLALADAGLITGTLDPERAGVSFGSDLMLSPPEDFREGILRCLDENRGFEFSRWAVEGLSQLEPLWLLKYLPNMPASHVAIFNQLCGPNNSITSREASPNLAVGEAFEIVAEGRADVMVCGSTGTRLYPMRMLRVIGQEEVATQSDPAGASRPFDRDRSGMVLGEGAGALLLEELTAAQSRGATIYGELIGQSSSSVADRNRVARRDLAMSNAMESALKKAQVQPQDVGHVNAHGLSTRKSDAEEAWAINRVFSARTAPLPVVAPKSYFGNLGAGSGMVELAASLLSLVHGRLFPVLNYATPDPECQLAIVTDGSTPPGDVFLNLNVTPNGQASAVLIRRLVS